MTTGLQPHPVVAGAVSAEKPRKVRTPGGRPLWLMSPTLLLLLLVIVVPFALAVVMSFLDLDQYSLKSWISAPFISFDNYSEALSTSGLLHSLWVSVAFSVLTTVVCAPIGLLAALAVNTPFRGRFLVRSLFLVPYVLPSFVTATVWRFILQPNGAFNHFLSLFGIDGGQWLIGDNTFWALVIVDIWAGWPFVYMMTIAGLQNIPNELYEAADMDGVTWWEKIRYVVLPQIRNQLFLGLLLSTLAHFNNFTLPFVLFGSPAPDPVLTLPVNIYQTSFQTFRFGLGAAMSVLSLILLLIPAVFYLRASRLTARAGED
ncbi:carbohydrate ABC transporter membrane protein 1, CUT1 family [Nakamurella panacisegetis]|uniref:Carbohydrate ABC transporter membrane protein 1, CUT1 family n=1 Tax=Nakamurella panacisegetis TaxID=1090615 RepID=A0A1H0N5T4_9ACTN|nr:sugar ABC transporter permease [Nakamurella panacisegetis]SDO87855.1 carbohydrate ABC transporter membrane protein 1, CUT1 family [Nakamurella panacisegetis]